MKIERVIKSNLSTDVKKRLYDYIFSVKASEDSKLPAESQLAALMGVSRITIRRALDELEQEGLILRIHGRGTFINPEATKIEVNLIPGEEFLKLIEHFGWNASCRVMGVRQENVSPEVADVLQIPVDTKVWRIEKVYYADGEPCIISVDQFPIDLADEDTISIETAKRPVFDLLRESSGVVILRDKIMLEAMTSKQTERLLKDAPALPCECAMVFHGINYDEENVPVMYDTEIYDTSKIKFSLMRIKTT